MKFYLGSYTRFGGPGVALCELCGDEMRLLATDPLPDATYVVLNKAQDRLFAVSSCTIKGEPGGSVASYDVSGGQLIRISHQNTSGADPCFPCLSPDERFLYTANYGVGSISVFPVENGVIGAEIQWIAHQGSGPNPERQLAPHAHQVTFIPGENRLCAVDLGTDEVVVYAQDAETGLLKPHDRLNVPGGLGPRHLCYGANHMAYLVHEIESQVSALRRENDQWLLKQTLPTLPAPDSSSTAAAIRLHGNRLYVSNRGYHSIAVYTLGTDGLLTLEAIEPTYDDFPRDFDFVDDHRLIIAHQKGTVGLYQRLGEKPLSTLDVHGAVCVCIQRL
ncbi:MAG: lactonase family protein [Eubacteriales bacterium]|nr:lactonase family protein [Eubacteriales bacterium]